MEKLDDIRLPPDDAGWSKNNPKKWPKLVYEDLVDYMIHRKAYDGKEMKAFRSLYGKNYVESEWLTDIYDCRIEDHHFLKAKVSPSQPGVGRLDYDAWVVVSDSSILTGYCTCPAGCGKSCSHIAAIAYAVIMAWDHAIAGESCTDKPRLWGRGSAKILSTHDEFSDIISDRSLNKQLKYDDKIAKPTQLIDHKDLETFVNKSTFKPLWDCKGTMLNKVLYATETLSTEKEPLQHGSHDIPTDCPAMPSCSSCKIFFDKYVAIGEARLIELCQETTHQSSSMWLGSRKVRITASKVNSLPKTARGNPDKFVTSHIYNRFKGCAATRYGQRSEPVARKWFQESTGMSVTQSGIVIPADEQYLGASPDGFVDSDTIVEIKCPTKPLQELIRSGTYDVCTNDDGKLFLNPKGKNGYYTQVQMTMYCTKTTICKFILWTAEDQVVLDVPFDDDYVRNLLIRV